MYRIIKTDGTELGVTDSVRYIKKSSEGSLIQTARSEAIGVAFEGIAYNLFGHSDIVGAETVIISEVTISTVLREQKELSQKLQASLDYIAMMAEVDIYTGESEAVISEGE